MLAYVFWHRAAEGVPDNHYERSVEHFHRSLAARPPEGFVGSASYRLSDAPWLAGGGLEDWYLVDDFAALGVLNEAAVARGHRTAHDAAARDAGEGAGGLYRLLEGSASLGTVRVATWVDHHGPAKPAVAALLGDGLDPAETGLWQRQLVLGPAPEFCLLGTGRPDGAREGRLATGWRADAQPREPVWVWQRDLR